MLGSVPSNADTGFQLPKFGARSFTSLPEFQGLSGKKHPAGCPPGKW